MTDPCTDLEELLADGGPEAGGAEAQAETQRSARRQRRWRMVSP